MANDGARRVLMPGVPENTNLDPEDPEGYLNYPAASPIVQLFHDANTWHVPLIVSAGPDGQLGLHEPNNASHRGDLGAVASMDALYDDLSNANSRGGP
jgi:hypothetical protein